MTISACLDFRRRVDELEALRSEAISMLAGGTPDRQKAIFMAEAIFFRLYREYERFVETVFIRFACGWPAPSSNPVRTVLRVDDIARVEDIVRGEREFVDWGKPDIILERANRYLEDGYPLAGVVPSFHSDLVNLNRIRNFIAHDSDSAAKGFAKVLSASLRTLPTSQIGAGEFLLMRGGRNNSYFLNYYSRRMIEFSTAIELA